MLRRRGWQRLARALLTAGLLAQLLACTTDFGRYQFASTSDDPASDDEGDAGPYADDDLDDELDEDVEIDEKLDADVADGGGFPNGDDYANLDGGLLDLPCVQQECSEFGWDSSDAVEICSDPAVFPLACELVAAVIDAGEYDCLLDPPPDASAVEVDPESACATCVIVLCDPLWLEAAEGGL